MRYQYEKFLLLVLVLFCFIPQLSGQCDGARMDANYELLTNDICEGELIPIANTTDQAGNMDVFYIWDWGDGTKDTLYDRSDVSHVYLLENLSVCSTPGGEASVSLRLDAIVPGCPQLNHFVIKPIFIKLKSEVLFDIPDIECNRNLTVTFQNQSCSPDPDVTYLWNFGDPSSGNNTSTEFEPSHTFSGLGAYTVSLTTDGYCGIDTFSQLITVSARTDANYEILTHDICEGELIPVTNTTDEEGNTDVIYIWDWGDGTKDTLYERTDTTHIYIFEDKDVCSTPGGETSVSLRLDAIVPGCPELNHFVIKPIFIKLRPEPQFTAPEFLCTPELTVDFNNLSCSSDPDATYLWDFGDPASSMNTSTEFEPTHVFSGPGSYNVRLTMDGFCGITTFNQLITIYDNPEADASFELSPLNGCTPVNIRLRNQSRFATNFDWNISPNNNILFINDTDNLSEEPEVRVTESGNYIFQLTARNICGSALWVDTLELFETPTVDLQPVPPGCDVTINFGDQVTYTGSAFEYQWTFENGNPATSNQATPSGVTFDTPGSHQVIVETISPGCGSDTDTIQVIVESSSIEYQLDSVLCLSDYLIVNGTQYDKDNPIGTEVIELPENCDSVIIVNLSFQSQTESTFNASFCQGESYVWNNETYTVPGEYQQQFVSANGCDSIVTLSLAASARPGIIGQPPPTTLYEICEGEDFPTFSLSAGNGATIDWYASAIGDDLLWEGSNTFTPPSLGFYFAEARSLNTGCTSNDRLMIEVKSVSITPSFQQILICDLEDVRTDTLMFSSMAGCDSVVIQSFELQLEDTIIFNEVICSGEKYVFGNVELSSSGVYTQQLMNIAGCDSTIILNLTSLDETGLAAQDDTFEMIEGDISASFSLTDNDDLFTDRWQISLLETPAHGTASLTMDGILDYRLTDRSFLGVDTFTYKVCPMNCLDECDTAVVRISVILDCQKEIKERIPSGFTPDGDGFNDLFDPFQVIKNIGCLQNPRNAALRVFNRWGELVYEAKSYLPWDGNFSNGKRVSKGTYYYVLRLEAEEVFEFRKVLNVLW